MTAPGYPAPAPPSMVRPIWLLAGPAFSALLAAGLLAAPVGPLASAIRRDLGVSSEAMTLTMAASFVAATVALVVPGYLLGRRWPIVTALPALVLLVLGNVLSASASGAALLAAGRVVVGLGAGAVAGVAVVLSGQVGRWRSPARLVLGLALGAALLLGPVVSGVLAQALGWRSVFLVDVVVAVLALLGTVVSGIAWAVARRAPLPAR
ncbi:MFS transporter [Micromonospora sp. NPDC047074]|uniref:MFS transporter n=1 Tax=Micromonospora sp. NPDC047074 TaxID=3154339 RepID=UPI0033FA383B